MTMRYRLIELLTDGRFHSGQSLGGELGISRAAVWKHIQTLAEYGLEIHAVRGQGYRLIDAFDPLHEVSIRRQLCPTVSARMQSLSVLHETDSTNDYLRRQKSASFDSSGVDVCIAEWQSAGRGRRGRLWVSPYGANLYLSLRMHINESVFGSGGLSLAAAVAVTETLQKCGINDLGLKWPNDIYYQGRKLAGILLDLAGESGGPYRVIFGVGVNFKMPSSAAKAIDQPWTDLSRSGVQIDRNQLAGMIIESLVLTMDRFVEHGLHGFIEQWERLDLVSGREVELLREREPLISGVARGIDDHGALLIETDGVTRSFHAGEISLRFS